MKGRRGKRKTGTERTRTAAAKQRKVAERQRNKGRDEQVARTMVGWGVEGREMKWERMECGWRAEGRTGGRKRRRWRWQGVFLCVSVSSAGVIEHLWPELWLMSREETSAGKLPKLFTG